MASGKAALACLFCLAVAASHPHDQYTYKRAGSKKGHAAGEAEAVIVPSEPLHLSAAAAEKPSKTLLAHQVLRFAKTRNQIGAATTTNHRSQAQYKSTYNSKTGTHQVKSGGTRCGKRKGEKESGDDEGEREEELEEEGEREREREGEKEREREEKNESKEKMRTNICANFEC